MMWRHGEGGVDLQGAEHCFQWQSRVLSLSEGGTQAQEQTTGEPFVRVKYLHMVSTSYSQALELRLRNFHSSKHLCFVQVGQSCTWVIDGMSTRDANITVD